jgi:hypothetical protein
MSAWIIGHLSLCVRFTWPEMAPCIWTGRTAHRRFEIWHFGGQGVAGGPHRPLLAPLRSLHRHRQPRQRRSGLQENLRGPRSERSLQRRLPPSASLLRKRVASKGARGREAYCQVSSREPSRRCPLLEGHLLEPLLEGRDAALHLSVI